MLRITTQNLPDRTVLKLEGRLAGPWIKELEELWRRIREADVQGGIEVDLCSILFIDAEGKRVLKALHEEGATFQVEGCLTQAVVEEVSGAAVGPDQKTRRKKSKLFTVHH